ncbi:MAG: 2-succinyl-5-enolpyruvyl-6-hydroxy-3-cyclohexene-1-carboxylic-acid synthase [Natronomonas sp.]
MTAPNVNTLWGRIIVDELSKAGIDAAVLAPGSRSTPLTVAFAERDDVTTYSILDERSAAFFALGRSRQTGTPTPLVCTSGTALANLHPAVVEATESGVPMLLLTADRPPELHDSGANQTIDQEKFYGDSVRDYRTLPEPEAFDRKLRSLRTALDRAVATASGTDPGPVHLDVPFRKPLEPTIETEDVPSGFAESASLAVQGRDGPFVDVTTAPPTPKEEATRAFAEVLETADAGLIVSGPSDSTTAERDALVKLAEVTGFPIFADPLSGLRYGPHVDRVDVCGGYDSYVESLDATPDVVIRFGASPTSKPLRHYLRDADARQIVVDPTGGWPEAEFTATDLVEADPGRFATVLAERVDRNSDDFAARIRELEAAYWHLVDGAEPVEGAVLSDTIELAPDPSTLFVSNSMPVRDLDRFAAPRLGDVSVYGNRGASGIDGIISTALGVGSATDEPLVCVIGDLAFYHDMNGLLSVDRCCVDATFVVVNNDGGGIFHLLPIDDHETFEGWFRTPHGLDFEHAAALYNVEFARTDDRETFRDLYADSVGRDGTRIIEVTVDGSKSHDDRESLHRRVVEELSKS